MLLVTLRQKAVSLAVDLSVLCQWTMDRPLFRTVIVTTVIRSAIDFFSWKLEFALQLKQTNILTKNILTLVDTATK